MNSMARSPEELRRDALAIWQAGLAAVRSDQLVRTALRVEDGALWVDEEPIDLKEIRRICVVGGGKAGAGMASAVEEILGPRWMAEKALEGWVNVPADCVVPLARIHLHAARPAGVNEPRPEGAVGTARILEMVGKLAGNDLCLALISGGGSALLPAPCAGITLDDKQTVTRFLSAAGANIEELNAVRKQLSQIKGGGLARACRAGRLIALIISDVLGDPLDVIASGPTVEDTSTPEQALSVLQRYGAREGGVSPRVFDWLERRRGYKPPRPTAVVSHAIIGNLSAAVDAAGLEAVRLGYSPAMVAARTPEGPAEEVGEHLAEMAQSMRTQHGPDCLVSGGEPVVRLVPVDRRGLGGRNQQLALAAMTRLGEAAGIALVSGGTDGEDGPTDAAGALVDARLVRAARERGLEPSDYLARNDAYHFFSPLGGLLKTGPTHTNVCDIRVVVVDRRTLYPGRPVGP